MRATAKSFLVAAGAAGVLALSVVNASAVIACTGNVCWHAKERHTYPSSARVTVHEDSWKWGPSERYSWREHEGRGYWSGETWTEF
jgi:hypothetical protein